MITVDSDFERIKGGGMYLSKEGKKTFLQTYEDKLNAKIIVKGKEMSYRQIMANEVQNYKNYILKREKYRPYKYY